MTKINSNYIFLQKGNKYFQNGLSKKQNKMY